MAFHVTSKLKTTNDNQLGNKKLDDLTLKKEGKKYYHHLSYLSHPGYSTLESNYIIIR